MTDLDALTIVLQLALPSITIEREHEAWRHVSALCRILDLHPNSRLNIE